MSDVVKHKCAPRVAMLDTKARAFTKEQAAKELTDNAIQSVILHFHARHTAALREWLEAALRALGDDVALDPDRQIASRVLPDGAKLDEWVHDLLHVVRCWSFVRAVEARNLADVCRAPGFSVAKLLAHDALARGDAPPQFWTAAATLAECVRTRAEPARREHPQVLLRYDLYAHTLECVDNGRGVAADQMKLLMELANTGHGADAAIGLGGVRFESHGSLSSGQISSFGVGALSAAASLCRPDGGTLAGGRFIVRSRADGSSVTAQREMSFEEVLGTQDWTSDEITSAAQREFSTLQRDLLAQASWGDRLTSVTVKGVCPAYCASLGEPDARRKILAFLEDAYYPIVHNGLCDIARTRPLQHVKLVVEFALADDQVERRELGSGWAWGRAPAPSAPYGRYNSEHPTIAELLASNHAHCVREQELHEPAAAAGSAGAGIPSSSLAALLGPELSLRCLVALPAMSAGANTPPPEKALLIFFYLPLVDGVETNVNFTHGVFAIQNGCRLAEQAPFCWPQMKPPINAAGRPMAARGERATLTTAAYSRVTGLLFLPPHCSIVENKSRLKSEDDRILREKLDWSQIVELPPELAGPTAIIEPTPRRRATAAASPSPAGLFGARKSLVDIYLDVFLARSRERDEDVLVDAGARVIQIGESGNFKLWQLSYMRKSLDANSDQDVWLRYSGIGATRSAHKVLGRVKYFVSKGGYPDPSKSARDGYDAIVERRSADEHDHAEETVPLAKLRGLDDVDVGEAEWAKFKAEERKGLPDKIELFADEEGSRRLDGAVLEALPDYMVVCGTKRNSRYDRKLPLQLVLARESTSTGVASVELVRADNSEPAVHAYKPHMPKRGRQSTAQDKSGGLHFFKLFSNADERALEPGAYVLTARVLEGRLAWFDEWCADLLGKPYVARFTICAAAPARAHLVWQRPSNGAQHPARSMLRMGCGALPDAYLVVTDKFGRLVAQDAARCAPVEFEMIAKPHGGEAAERTLALAVKVVEMRTRPELDLSACASLSTASREALAASPELRPRRAFSLALAADGFRLPLEAGAAAKPRPCRLVLRARAVLALGDGRTIQVDVAGIDEAARSWQLVAGAPSELDVPPSPPPLAPGARTVEVAVQLRDRWGNVCAHDADGERLGVRCSDARGVELNDARALLRVETSREHWGRLIVPSMAVSADFGGSASLALALDSEPAVRAQLCWALEARRLAFGADGAQRPVADANGATSTTIDVGEGDPVTGIVLQLHMPPAAQNGGEAVGALDRTFHNIHVEVHDERTRKKILFDEGVAEVGWTVIAPRAGATRTLVATHRGLRATLTIRGEHLPLDAWSLTATPSDARAGEAVTLTLTLLNRRGEPARERVDVGAVTVRTVGEATGASAAAASRNPVVSSWAAAQRRSQRPDGTCVFCTVTPVSVGALTLALDGLDRVLPGRGVTAPPPLALRVRPGPPVALQLSLDDSRDDDGDDGGNLGDGDSVTLRRPFAVRAALVDGAGNACEQAPELRGEWRVELEDPTPARADFCDGKGQGKRRVTKPSAAELLFSGLQLRLRRGATLPPAPVRLFASWQPVGGGPPLRSPPLALRLVPSGEPYALFFQHDRYYCNAQQREPVVLRARIALDDGGYTRPMTEGSMRLQLPGARGRTLHGRLAGDDESCYVSFEMRAPDSPCELELRACFSGLDDAVTRLSVAAALPEDSQERVSDTEAELDVSQPPDSRDLDASLGAGPASEPLADGGGDDESVALEAAQRAQRLAASAARPPTQLTQPAPAHATPQPHDQAGASDPLHRSVGEALEAQLKEAKEAAAAARKRSAQSAADLEAWRARGALTPGARAFLIERRVLTPAQAALVGGGARDEGEASGAARARGDDADDSDNDESGGGGGGAVPPKKRRVAPASLSARFRQ